MKGKGPNDKVAM